MCVEMCINYSHVKYMSDNIKIKSNFKLRDLVNFNYESSLYLYVKYFLGFLFG